MKQGNETGSLGQEGEWHLKLNGQGRPHLAGVIGVKGGPLSSGHSWQPVLPPLQCRQGGRKLSSGGPGLGNGGGQEAAEATVVLHLMMNGCRVVRGAAHSGGDGPVRLGRACLEGRLCLCQLCSPLAHLDHSSVD